MTSMFDQYNTTLKREEVPSSQIVNIAPTSSGYVSVRTKEETPIFTKRKMPINLPNDILFTRVCNNWLVVLMSDNVLLRLYLVQSDQQNGKEGFVNFCIEKFSIYLSIPFSILHFRGVSGEVSHRFACGKFIFRSNWKSSFDCLSHKVPGLCTRIIVFASQK